MQSEIRQMAKTREKRYCTLDHANKRRELAKQTPYEFWLTQLRRRGTAEGRSGPVAFGRKDAKPEE